MELRGQVREKQVLAVVQVQSLQGIGDWVDSRHLEVEYHLKERWRVLLERSLVSGLVWAQVRVEQRGPRRVLRKPKASRCHRWRQIESGP